MSTRLQPRSRDEKKVTESKQQKNEDGSMDAKGAAAAGAAVDDVYEFKPVKESEAPADKAAEQPEAEGEAAANPAKDDDNKRNFSDMADGNQEEAANDDEVRRKKRKEDNPKEGGGA